jgi:16S rRNA (guanine527-N7)-methyltransferase
VKARGQTTLSPKGEGGGEGAITVTSEGSLKQLLSSGAKELGVELSEAQAGSCFLYLSELKKWNRKINLTAIKEDREIVIKHFLDSFSFARGFTPKPGTELLDMGSGAGFPALPLKIAYLEITVIMVESVKKKASFLRHIIRTLGLTGVEVIDKRTDELPDSYRSRFDIVTARAFATMDKALATGAPFLKPGGLMVLSRGPEEGIDGAALEGSGFTLERTKLLTLPSSDYRRAIWVFRKKA